MDTKAIIVEVAKLNLGPADRLLIRVPKDGYAPDIGEHISARIQSLWPELGGRIMVCPTDIDVSVISTDEQKPKFREFF